MHADMRTIGPTSQTVVLRPATEATDWPILIGLLGSFRVLRNGSPVAMHGGAKSASLLRHLALSPGYQAARDVLLDVLWRGTDPEFAGQSLNSLVYSLRKLLGPALGGASPVQCVDGYYCLNQEAGVGVDVACFEALAQAGDPHACVSMGAGAAESCVKALALYRGDLCADQDMHSIVERERLRSRYLGLLARLAEYHYNERAYAQCLTYALKLLANDLCREDGHRLVMRSYMGLGERAQALHQYRLCEAALRQEFDAVPEPATAALFDQLRGYPRSCA